MALMSIQYRTSNKLRAQPLEDQSWPPQIATAHYNPEAISLPYGPSRRVSVIVAIAAILVFSVLIPDLYALAKGDQELYDRLFVQPWTEQKTQSYLVPLVVAFLLSCYAALWHARKGLIIITRAGITAPKHFFSLSNIHVPFIDLISVNEDRAKYTRPDTFFLALHHRGGTLRFHDFGFTSEVPYKQLFAFLQAVVPKQ